MKRQIALWALTALLAAGCCGKTLGRIALSGEGTGSTTVELQSGSEVAFWTNLDVSFEGNFAAAYDVQLSQGGKVVASATCNPFDVSTKINSVSTNLNGKRSEKYEGKMRCEAKVPSSGATTVNTKLTFASRPANLKVIAMDLLIKQ